MIFMVRNSGKLPIDSAAQPNSGLVTAASWVAVLLFGSKGDTYRPFPSANMMGVMGLARSQSLKNRMITGWMVLVPACIMYGLILFFQTR